MITIDIRWIEASGIGTYIQNVVPGIIRAMPEERFTLICRSDSVNNLEHLLSSNVRLIGARSKMYSLFEQIEIPRLIPHETTLFFSPHYPIPLGYKGKLLVTVHDAFHLAMPRIVGGWHKTLYARFMFSQVCKRASAIITDSTFTKVELKRLLPYELSNIYSIYLGVDSSWRGINLGKSPHHRPYLVFVGNIKPNKNLTRLVEAFTKILHTIPHDLILIGKKSGFITGDSKVLSLSEMHSDRIIFTDFISDENLKHYLVNATALIFPSLYEGFGLPPLEAMSCGCPVLVSNRASLPEVCGGAALYFDPEDVEDMAEKIRQIATDAALRDEMRVMGIHQSDKFSWEKTVNQTVKVIQNLLG
jgi:glycosyltransferase involved in cell wall biosynthesis